MTELGITVRIFSSFLELWIVTNTGNNYFPLSSQTKFHDLELLYSSGKFQVPIPILINAEEFSHFPTVSWSSKAVKPSKIFDVESHRYCCREWMVVFVTS